MLKASISVALAAVAGLSCVAAFAVSAESVKPWTERAITFHLSQSDYAGPLEETRLNELIDHGERLFKAKFTTLDGAGRPGATQAIIPTKRKRPRSIMFQRTAGPDANSCESCHREPAVGGAGDFSVNVFVSEGFTNADFDTIDPQFSNERNTNHLFGSGLVELLAREMTAELHAIRKTALRRAREMKAPVESRLVAKDVDFGSIVAAPDGVLDLTGIEGVDTDLVIRPFSQKGVITSLRQFTLNALNDHHGIQGTERFGERWTGETDFDGDGIPNELTAGDVSAMVAWQATRPAPREETPDDPQWRQASEQGSHLFDRLQCAQCHKRALPLDSAVFVDPGPLDAAGTLRSGDVEHPGIYDLGRLDWVKRLPRNENGQIMVPLFGDLKRHHMTDAQVSSLGNELLSQRFVDRDVFQTTELWGVGSTAPYGHRGNFTTLDEVIRAHGGQARESRDAYAALDADERNTLIAFLKTLVIEP